MVEDHRKLIDFDKFNGLKILFKLFSWFHIKNNLYEKLEEKRDIINKLIIMR